MSDRKEAWASIAWFAPSVFLLVLGTYVLSMLAKRPELLGASTILVDANLAAIAASAFAFSVCLVAIMWNLKYRPERTKAVLCILAPFMLFVIGVVAVALQKAQPTQSINPVAARPDTIERRTLVVPLLYGMGSESLSGEQMGLLSDVAGVIRSCNPRTVRVVGFASSAPFRLPDGSVDPRSNERNTELANLRAKLVSDSLSTAGLNSVAHGWLEYQPMARLRRIQDSTAVDGLIPALERLNRRVELEWHDVECTPGANFVPAVAASK